MSAHPYRLGFAVKILGGGGLRTADARRWQTGPHLARSIELLHAAFDHLDARGLRMFRLSSGTVPYGTHPDLPELDHRRQIDECEDELAALGARARAAGIRLSTHPGQYTVLNATDPDVAAKARADVEQDALLLDALGADDEAVVVIHVGGAYGDSDAALYRFSRSYELLSERARRRLVVEHDERLFSLADVLGLHERHGMRVVYDHHHHRCNPAPGLEDPTAAIAAACATWPDGVRPKVHLSSPRTELRLVRRAPRDRGRVRSVPVPPTIEQHADFATPWDLAELLDAAPGPVDVMVEAKAKDLAVLWLRDQLVRLRPDLAELEERSAEAGAATPAGR
jgi:UV DNA damage endonuclease